MESIFLLDTDLLTDRELFQRCRQSLSEERQAKADRFCFARDRRLSLGAGAALDFALSRYGLREKTVQIVRGAHGKPCLKQSSLRFNLSHSGHWAVCAVSDEQEVGVDIQVLRPVRDALLQRVCTVGETALLQALPPPEREVQFCRLWTVKESYGKLLGTGLSLPLKELETSLSGPLRLYRNDAPLTAAFTQWELPGGWLTLCTPAACQPQLIALTPEDLQKRYAEDSV